MPKTKISEYSTTNSANTDIESINIDEGCAPSGINNAIRELMVHLKEFQTGASGDAFTFAGGTLMSGTNTISGAAIISGNINSSGTNTFSGSNVMSFSGGSSASPSIYFASDTNTGIFSPAADTIAFTEGGAEAMRIDSSGNVGIGTTSPAYKLDVVSTSMRIASGTTGVGYVQYGNSATAANNYHVGTEGDGTFRFFNGNVGSGTERARITSGGDLFINTTSELLVGRKLQVVRNAGGSVIFKTEGSVGSEVLILWNNETSGNNLFQEFATEGSVTVRGSIDYNRGAGQVRYNVTSDATLKNIIGDADGQKSLEILNSTRIREYAWKDDPTQKPQIGVIAQELYETFKGAVSVGGEVKETDDDGNVTTKHRHWGVDKTAFTFHLVAGWQAHEKVIQELKAINDAQATRIETLEAQNAAFEARLAALEAK